MLEKCTPPLLLALFDVMLEAWNAGKVQPSITFCVFGIHTRIPRIQRRRCQEPQFRPPKQRAGVLGWREFSTNSLSGLRLWALVWLRMWAYDYKCGHLAQLAMGSMRKGPGLRMWSEIWPRMSGQIFRISGFSRISSFYPDTRKSGKTSEKNKNLFGFLLVCFELF